MSLVAGALARCRRDANGLLKLGDLWRDPHVAHHHLSHAIKRAGLAPHVVAIRTGRTEGRGLFAPERVARQLAQLIPPEHLWTADAPDVPDLAEDRAAAEAPATAMRSSDVGQQLSELLGHPVNFQLRTTPAGEVALIDVAMIFTGLASDQAGLAVRRLLEGQAEIRSLISNFHFPGRGQRSIHVAPLAVALDFAFLLPGKAAAQMRRQAAALMVRYLGGDASLVEEVYANRRAQASLAAIPAEQRTPQQQAARLCGEAVEDQAATVSGALPEPLFVPRKPLVIQDQDSVGLPGSDHLYAAGRHGENLIKIGVSKDVLQRMRELPQSFGGQYELLAVWPHEAVLESLVLELLKTAKASVGSSREHFNANASFEQICQIVDSARHLHRLKIELEAVGLKRRREEAEFEESLADRALKRRQQEMQMKQEEAQTSLLLELVRTGDAEAKRVFLAGLAAS